ncbi:hypothetical protein BDB01DRAFT_877791 [Pilobolus umbonatus]|nr:hypothetical protein BDB01DRAFT_877791 [Pilobolus umbonatus]
MYSPKRKESYSSILKTPDRSSLLNTPSNPFTPLVNVIKSAQSKANEDFDRFYGSLWATITPRNTDYHSIKKRVPEVTQRAQSMINQKHVDMETKSRTSLTPLIERHTLREGNILTMNVMNTIYLLTTA